MQLPRDLPNSRNMGAGGAGTCEAWRGNFCGNLPFSLISSGKHLGNHFQPFSQKRYPAFSSPGNDSQAPPPGMAAETQSFWNYTPVFAQGIASGLCLGNYFQYRWDKGLG